MYFFYYIPVGIDSELRKFPFLTYFFSLICLAVFILNRYFRDYLPLNFYNLIYTPEDSGLIGAVMAAFLHFGYLHLIGNLVYLLVFGRYVEDRLGPVVYSFLFLSSSAVGNTLQGLFNSYVMHKGIIGIIGASGSIAGILGAFAVRFYANRLRIAYWVFMPLQAYTRAGHVGIPAVLAIALWFVLQSVQGLLQAGGIPSDVAYVTHISGFLWGMLLAVALGGHREAVIEHTWRRAQQYLAKGEAYAAQGELLKYRAMRPDDERAFTSLARGMLIAGDKSGACAKYREACERLLAKKERGKAEDLFREALYVFQDFTLSSEKHLELAFGLERNLKPKLALKAYENFEMRYPLHKEAPFALLRLANLYWNTFDNRERAIYCYKKLIDVYPEDEWVDFAREQVRIMRWAPQDAG